MDKYSDDLMSIEDVFPKGKTFRILFDSNVGKMKIIATNYNLFSELRDAFSAENKAAFFVRQYGYNPESKIYQINKFGYFSPGLVFELLSWIKQQYGSLDCVAISSACKAYICDYVTPLKSFLPENRDISNISDDCGRNSELRREGKKPFEFRDYQKNAIYSLIFNAYGRGLIELPTASGKSFVLSNFIWNLHKNFNRNYKYLILVPNKQLVNQFYKDLIDYGWSYKELTMFTAGLKGNMKFNPDAMIIIANRQYIFKNKERLPKIDVLICDEVHQILASSSSEFVESLGCKIKIGCSGTIPRDQNNRWKLVGMFGKICYTEDIVNLQKQNFISKLKITVLNITDNQVKDNKMLLFHPNSLIKYKADDFSENGIMFNDAFNAEKEWLDKNYLRLYTPVLNYVEALDENTLILFDKVDIGKNMHNLGKEVCNSKKCFYIDGSIAVEEREAIRQEFESSSGNVLFAQTACFSTGVNIKRLNHICFAFQSKGFSRVLQSIGRTLRLHESKQYAHLVDLVFNFKYSRKQFKERMQIYRDMYNIQKPDEVVKFEV